MKAIVWFDTQDPQNPGWTVDWRKAEGDGYYENCREPLEVCDKGLLEDAIAAAAKYLGIDPSEVGTGEDSDDLEPIGEGFGFPPYDEPDAQEAA